MNRDTTDQERRDGNTPKNGENPNEQRPENQVPEPSEEEVAQRETPTDEDR